MTDEASLGADGEADSKVVEAKDAGSGEHFGDGLASFQKVGDDSLEGVGGGTRHVAGGVAGKLGSEKGGREEGADEGEIGEGGKRDRREVEAGADGWLKSVREGYEERDKLRSENRGRGVRKKTR